MKRRLTKTILPISVFIFLAITSLQNVYAAPSCTCPLNFTYDGSTNSCVFQTPSISCTSLSHGGIPQGCSCPDGFVVRYSGKTASCVPPQPVNCGGGQGIGTSCTCDTGFSYNAKTNSCVEDAPSPACNSITINSPFNTDPATVFTDIITHVVTIFLFVVGVALLALIFYAGFTYMTDAGNEENAKKARKIITSAVIGLAIIGFTGIILRFISALFGIQIF